MKTITIQLNPETGGVNLQAEGITDALQLALILNHVMSITLGKIAQPPEDAPLSDSESLKSKPKIIVPSVVPPRKIRRSEEEGAGRSW